MHPTVNCTDTLSLMVPDRKKILLWSCMFWLSVGCVSWFAGIRYISEYAFPHETPAVIYTVLAFTTHLMMLCFIPGIGISGVLILLGTNKKVLLLIQSSIGCLILSTILLDSMVFAEHRFHLNGLTIRILGSKSFIFMGIYSCIFLALFLIIAQKLWKIYVDKKKNVRLWIILCIVFGCHGAVHGLHAWADAQYMTAITRFTPHLPLFYPTTAKRFFQRHKLIDPNKAREQRLYVHPDKTSQEFCYPTNQLSFDQQHKYNIILIVIDALRYDACNEKLMPRLTQRAMNHAISFTNHYSGGNSTRMGMFSLFYGLPNTLWEYIHGSQISPVLMDRISQLQYQTGIFGSDPLNVPSNLDRTAFGRIQNLRISVPSLKDAAYSRDSTITADWLSWLSHTAADSKSFFGFLFYSSPSGYSYPDRMKNTVLSDNTPLSMQKEYTDYRISVRYIDSLVDHILTDISEKNLLTNTIVIVTSDHGEEFDDLHQGIKGHGSGFSRYQLQVPCIVFWPEKKPAVISKRTSHNDLTTTLMTEAFGCTNPASDYSVGNNLFSQQQWQWLHVGSYYNNAILLPEYVIVQYPSGYYETRDSTYQIRNHPPIDYTLISTAFNQTMQFFKK